MNKSDFVKAIGAVLRENKVSKPVTIPKRVFKISDEDGNSKEFSVKSSDKNIPYTHEDIKNMLDACLAILEDNIRRGEELNIHGMGTIGVAYRAPRMAKIPGTNEWAKVPGRYVPKFTFGNVLRLAALSYQQSLNEQYDEEIPAPIYDEYETADEEIYYDGDE